MSENLKNKFNRVASDPTQLQQFADGILGGEVPAKKAEQTAEGIVIDEAIAALQEAIAGKVGFDGEIVVTYPMGNPVCTAPLEAGIYKLINQQGTAYYGVMHYKSGAYFIVFSGKLLKGDAAAGTTIALDNSNMLPIPFEKAYIGSISDYNPSLGKVVLASAFKEFLLAFDTGYHFFYAEQPSSSTKYIACVERFGSTYRVYLYNEDSIRMASNDHHGDDAVKNDVMFGRSILLTYASDNDSLFFSQWDTEPTENSTKPVTSGGIYNALKAIPVLTSDNVLDIIAKAPKQIVYVDTVYNLQDVSETPDGLYYSSINGSASTSLYLTTGEPHIQYDSVDLAAQADVGTKLYKHTIKIDGCDDTSEPDSIDIVIYNNIRQSFGGTYTSAFDLKDVLLNNKLQCHLASDPMIFAIDASDVGQTTKLLFRYLSSDITIIELYGYLNYTVTDTVTAL